MKVKPTTVVLGFSSHPSHVAYFYYLT